MSRRCRVVRMKLNLIWSVWHLYPSSMPHAPVEYDDDYFVRFNSYVGYFCYKTSNQCSENIFLHEIDQHFNTQRWTFLHNIRHVNHDIHE